MTPEEKARAYEVAKQLLSEQNFPVAVVSGSIAAVLAGGIYAVITSMAGYSVSFMAIGVGVLVGFTIQFLGRGVETKYAILASVLAVLGCVLGNVFAVMLIVARATGGSLADLASQISLETIVEYAIASFQLIDIVYWLLAIWAASYFAKRALTREEGLAIYTYEKRPPRRGGIIT